MRQASVVALHLKPGPDALVSVDELHAVSGQGFVGDRCFGRSTRQALLVSMENLRQFGYAPGALREQITVDFDGLQTLPVGTRLQVGEVILEIEKDCTPCVKMAGHLGEDPAAFVTKTLRRRGMLALVRSDGAIRVGDGVKVIVGAN